MVGSRAAGLSLPTGSRWLWLGGVDASSRLPLAQPHLGSWDPQDPWAGAGASHKCHVHVAQASRTQVPSLGDERSVWQPPGRLLAAGHVEGPSGDGAAEPSVP